MAGPDYTRTAVRALLGATAHPGGRALTRHLLDRLALPPGSLVADVACGDGASLRVLAEHGLLGVGVDLEPRAVRRAGSCAVLGVGSCAVLGAGSCAVLGADSCAVLGDALALPLRPGAYDAVLCECSLSTFDDPARALAGMARLLRPGGQLALTDITLRRDLAAAAVVDAVDGLTHARTAAEYCSLIEAAGLRVVRVEDRAADALALAHRVARRLRMMGARQSARSARQCAEAVETGALSYVLVVAAAT